MNQRGTLKILRTHLTHQKWKHSNKMCHVMAAVVAIEGQAAAYNAGIWYGH